MAKNRRVRQREKRRQAALDADLELKADPAFTPEREKAIRNQVDVENGAEATGGGPGSVFTDPKTIRSDARLAARYIGLGVIDDAESVSLLRKGYELAKTTKKPREFVALMKLPIAVNNGVLANQLGQIKISEMNWGHQQRKDAAQREAEAPIPYEQDTIEGEVLDGPTPIAFLDGASEDELLATWRELQSAGIMHERQGDE